MELTNIKDLDNIIYKYVKNEKHDKVMKEIKLHYNINYNKEIECEINGIIHIANNNYKYCLNCGNYRHFIFDRFGNMCRSNKMRCKCFGFLQ